MFVKCCNTHVHTELPAAVPLLQEPGDQIHLGKELQGLDLQEEPERIRTRTTTRDL